MFTGLVKFWRDLMTESDGVTYCPVRIFGTGLVSTHIGGTLVQVIQHGTFDPIAFGTGSAALIGAVGAGIGIKSKLGAG